MEPTVLSGPLGHSEWESEQPFPLGFHTLDSDKEGMLPQNKTGQTGLDFKNVDPDHTCQHSEEEEIFQDEPLNLDSLIEISGYSCGDDVSQLEGDQSTNSQGALQSTLLEELSYTEKTDGLRDDIGDCALSWLFSPSLTDLVGENSACEELSPTQDAPPEDTSVPSSQGELISLSEPSSPLKISERTSETNTEASFLLVDLLSCEQPPSCLIPERTGEVNPQGVSEEQVLLSLEEHTGLPPSQGGETLSPETGDKGLFLEPVTDLPIASNTTPQGLPENCFLHNHISTPPEFLEGSVPLLDLKVPDCDSNLSLCPTTPASLVCTGAPLDSPTEALEEEHTLATMNSMMRKLGT
ncbi:uncharacterized protein LOC144543001 [Centroberyx gerrardi]